MAEKKKTAAAEKEKVELDGITEKQTDGAVVAQESAAAKKTRTKKAKAKPEETKDAPKEETKDGDKKHKADFQELIEKGKAKGSLTNEEILEVLDEAELDVENMEKLMETIENLGIEVTGYNDDAVFDDLNSNLDSSVDNIDGYDSDDTDTLLAQEGLIIDDPVKMYLKEIGKVNLLST